MFAATSMALAAAAVGLLGWTATGWWVARRLGWDTTFCLAIAPALGWALQTTVAWSLSFLFGLSILVSLASIVLIVAAAAVAGARLPRDPDLHARMPGWIYLAAAALAVVPALALLPKHEAAGVLLSAPIFDHSKITLIDQLIREGAPPANPVFGESADAGVAYYYLWHFGAAQLGKFTGASGWEADIAASGFTAFASLSLMCGIAFHLSRRVVAPVFVLLACATGSLRPTIGLLFDQERIDRIVEPATGLGGWLFQTTWSPHHVASATCAVLAALLLARLAFHASVLLAIVLALVLAGAFGSSIWVGGVVTPLAVCFTLIALLFTVPATRRNSILVVAVSAAFIAMALCAPLLIEQAADATGRGSGIPIRIAPQYVLGIAFPVGIRRILDIPAYWLVLLVLEFPVVLFAGIAAFAGVLRRPAGNAHEPVLLHALGILAAVSLCCGWWMFSTTGSNNDLGWRAVLPGLLVLTGAAGAGFAHWVVRRSTLLVSALVFAIAAAAPGGLRQIRGNATGEPSPSASLFSEAPEMWAAVRKHAPIDARVANNPQAFADMTPWPVNIGWALLADRRSCFAGKELALAFAPLSPSRRADITNQFDRMFSGAASKSEIATLVHNYRCDIVLLTAQDGAWPSDPFAMNEHFRLAESRENAWRIYLVNP